MTTRQGDLARCRLCGGLLTWCLLGENMVHLDDTLICTTYGHPVTCQFCGAPALADEATCRDCAPLLTSSSPESVRALSKARP